MVLSLNLSRSGNELTVCILKQQIPLFMECPSLLQQGGEKSNLTLNERDKVLPSVFFGRLLSFHFFALFFFALLMLSSEDSC